MKTLTVLLTFCFFVLAILVPIYRVWKRTGKNPVAFSKEPNTYNFIGKIFKLTIVLLITNVVIYAFIEPWYKFLGELSILSEFGVVAYIGVSIVFISLMLIVVAQNEMSNSWRIGIDVKNKTTLITSGIFKISRNPIFLGVQLSLLGLFLITPNTLMLVLLVVGILCIHIQVRLEEEFLEKSHPKEYLNYKTKVNRWI